MEEQLISFETAKLAKEKGFNFYSNSFYCDNYPGLCVEGDEILYIKSLNQHIYDVNYDFETGTKYYASTQSLLDKWLRDKHNLFVAVYPINDHWEADVRNCNKENRVHYSLIWGLKGNSYEEVLEKGLYKALKKIKK